MQKFRRKPPIVEAEQFFPDEKPWPKGVEENTHSISKLHLGWILQTPEGGYTISPGDWVITDAEGELHYCKRDVFEATYEPI